MKLLLLLAVFGPDVASLSADDFDAREAAEARLSRWADLAHPLLDRPFADPEVRRRARRVVARAVPATYPPLALLSRPLQAEWHRWGLDSEGDRHLAITFGPRPAADHHLAYLRPGPYPWPLGAVAKLYDARARTQRTWLDWQSVPDGREATRLLCRDLRAVGVPSPLVRRFVAVLEGRERALGAVTVPENLGVMPKGE